MDKHAIIDNFFEELATILYDVKCEALINQGMQQSIRPEDFTVTCDGHFYREYRKDLYHLSRLEDSWHNESLELHLSRAGIYDFLPEGLFHQPITDRKNNRTVADMAAGSRIDKRKEASARKFFQPIEQAYFLQRVQLESEEENLLLSMDSGLLNDYFFHFWGFPEQLNRTSAELLVLLLPYAHKIAGNLKLMEDCLTILLQETVLITTIPATESSAGNLGGGMGNFQLGNDMVCGSTFGEDYPHLQYTIGPLQNTHPADYVPGGENDVLLQVFNNYFVPAEADITINVEMDREKALLQLSTADSPILGYSSTI